MPDELLTEVRRERFPDWRQVLNEESAARQAAERLRDAQAALRVDRPTADNDLVRRARRRILEGLPETGEPARGRTQRAHSK